jgi:hypothetical protein
VVGVGQFVGGGGGGARGPPRLCQTSERDKVLNRNPEENPK